MTGRGLWFLGGEPNTMPPGLFDSSIIKVLIVRLSSYTDVAAGITHSYLYQMASEVSGCYVDMAFMPPLQDERLFLEANIPLLTGTTSKKPANEFDIIAISNSVLQELINLPALLHYSGIPLKADDRINKKSPFILIGGSNSYNLSVLFGENGKSAIVDGVLIGDGEISFGKIIEIVKQNKANNRETLLSTLRNNVRGFYDPSCYISYFDENSFLSEVKVIKNAPEKVLSNKINTFNLEAAFNKGPILYDEKTAGSSHVILSSGCPSFCSFCKESWEQKPYRERTPEHVINDAIKLKTSMGLSEISLMTFNANTYSYIFEVIDKLENIFDRVAIKSQRFDAIVKLPALLDRQIKAGKKNYTCAMEGISRRIRTLLQKNLSDDILIKGLETLLDRGIRQLKIFLILSGYETKDDVNEFKEFLKALRILVDQKRSKPRISFSFACLFRPPMTPMQYFPERKKVEIMREDLDLLCSIVKKSGFEARISAGPYDAELSEFIAYADGRSISILCEASIQKGFRYRGEITRELYLFWKKRLKETNIALINHKKHKDENTVFPWTHISVGISQKFLYKNYKKLLNNEEITSCISRPWGTGNCSGCGACPDNETISRLSKVGPDITTQIRDKITDKIEMLRAIIRIPKKWNFCSREFIKAAAAQKIMEQFSEFALSFVKVERIDSELFSHGIAVVDLKIKKSQQPLDLTVSKTQDENQIQIIKINKLINNKLSNFPVSAEICFDTEIDESKVLKNIDSLLTKYKIKHQKQWLDSLLNWTVNKGQAKKSGINFISWHPKSKVLKLNLSKWPELHIINKLALDHELEITNFSNI